MAVETWSFGKSVLVTIEPSLQPQVLTLKSLDQRLDDSNILGSPAYQGLCAGLGGYLALEEPQEEGWKAMDWQVLEKCAADTGEGCSQQTRMLDPDTCKDKGMAEENTVAEKAHS